MKMKNLGIAVGIGCSLMISGVTMTQVSASTENVPKIINKELGDLAYNRTYNEFRNNNISKAELLPSDGGRWDSLRPMFVKVNPLTSLNNDMRIEKGKTIAAHVAMLENRTNNDHNYKTAEFSYTKSDTVTTSTTHSVGVSMTSGGKMEFPFFEASVSMTAKYDFGTTKPVQTSEVRQWKVPAQDIKVPAGKKYRVSWLLNTGIATGTVNLIGRVEAEVPYKLFVPRRFAWSDSRDLVSSIKAYDEAVKQNRTSPYIWGARNDWQITSDGEAALRKLGDAKYTANYGTELVMLITDVTSTRGRALPVEIQRITLPIQPETIG
ncbi:ETX/MTX2 family pore-forming toxin [Pseudolactococcus plantarum]|uniref:Uncharacterized protein n=1 Tax=Pseudolactococcus plantarum TaxID=1365 RepID=A0A2A5S1A7_9LACT|nr:ETX/MTX2 family pore-forming toxin [Lactococcus plantarum]PCS07244.1 hypothetical protein RU87_GL001297 [Lactococcus plantarum]HCN74974.1 hypothetical protein [Lactococcus sp.]